MTEEEAREKVCPFMSEGVFTKPNYDSYQHIKVERQNCIVSDCMMWVKDHTITRNSQNIDDVVIVECGGHCGLVKRAV